MIEADPSNTAGGPGRGTRRRLIAGSAVAVVVALVAGTALVFAHGGGRHHGHGRMTAEEMADHVEHFTEHVLSEIEATDAQKAQIMPILQSAVRDVTAMRGRHEADHQQLRDILSAPSIDRARLESMRAEHMRMADEASSRMVAALADAAEVLTPEQRTELARTIEERHHARHGNHQ